MPADPKDAKEVLFAQVAAADGPVATHDLLDAVQAGLAGVDEVELLEALMRLVEEGRLSTMSDHGTVYFFVDGDAR